MGEVSVTVQTVRSRVSRRRFRPVGSGAPTATPLPAGPSAEPGWFTPAALAVSAVALGYALQVNFGQYHPLALAWLSAGLLACVAAAVLPNFGTARLFGRPPELLIAGGGLVLQFFQLFTTNPGATVPAEGLPAFRVGLIIAVVATAVAVAGPARWRAVAVVAMLAAHAALGAWVLHTAPRPGVDVYVFQDQACAALLRGENPYAMTFPDPYAGAGDRFYAPGAASGGRLHFGYPYPPLTLWMVLPAHLLAGDFRFAQLAAVVLSGALIAFARPGRLSALAAALLLFTPRGFFVLEAGWTEPLVVVLLAATVFTAVRTGGGRAGVPSGGSKPLGRMLALPVALGLFLASKQYLVLALPAVVILLRPGVGRAREGKRAFLVALGSGLVVSLPLVLWDLPAFLHSAVTLQFRQPFRPDALSYLVPIASSGWGQPPAWVGFIFALPAIALSLWRCPRGPAGFSSALALVLFAFFAFNKQAFCNYYYLVLGALCCALATTPGGRANSAGSGAPQTLKPGRR